MRRFGALEQLLHVGLLRSQQRGMLAELMPIGDERLPLSHVIEGPKRVLQLPQSRQGSFPPLGLLVVGKDAGEKLNRIAQILRFDPELVPLLGIDFA
jgi:hypothetical protein